MFGKLISFWKLNIRSLKIHLWLYGNFNHPYAGLVLMLWAACVDASAQSLADTHSQQSILQKQREEAAQNQQLANEPDVRLPRIAVPKSEFPGNESPCFPIRVIRLEGKEADAFQWLL